MEWVSMADNRASVFIPCPPMMTEEVIAPFYAATRMPVMTEEKPSRRLSCATDAGWGIYPEGWQESWYWVFARLEHVAWEDKAWWRATNLLKTIGN